MSAKITFKGTPLTLAGRVLKTGVIAPDFKVVSQELKEVSLRDFKGRIKILTSFPSLDTPVCDLQVKEFNKRATGLSGEVVILGISKDLPFAQKRFCETFEIKNVKVLSDYKSSSFGINYGLLIKELNLLARSILIVDQNDTLRYIQVTGELTDPVDYEDALKNLAGFLNNPPLPVKEELSSKCKPCEVGTGALPKEQIGKMLDKCPGWELIEGRKLAREFKFNDFSDAKYFLDIICVIAEEQGHHPALTLTYNKLKVSLTTQASGGLTENDFIMAKIINEL